jgi:UDP-GlcNAc:undecaprenyl-phosphate/decaprenyl-phosphate GlcNAc-1-phosphate transferase
VTLYESYGIVVAFAVGATFVLTFPVRAIASRLGAVDQPGEHRMHAHPTPVVGGAAMLLAFCGSVELASRLAPLSQIFAGSSEPLGVVLAAAVIYLFGLVDGVRDISAPAKVAGQVLAAMILVFLGVTMYYFKIPFETGTITLSPEILPLITAVWVVGMANAVNLIDGLDGLAAGIVGIASAALCIYGLRLVHLGDLGANNLGPLVAAITFGVCIGFLPHNFHPAKVFMGDGGALFLGLVMAASTMVIGGRTETVATFTDVPGLTFFRFAPLFIPFFILGVPILDTAFAIVRRSARRANFAERDLGHLHHRLVRLGHGHRRAVLILWAWTALLSAFVLVPTFAPQANAYVPIGLGALAVGLLTVFRPAGRPLQNGRGSHPLYEDPEATPSDAVAAEAVVALDDDEPPDDTEALDDNEVVAHNEPPDETEGLRDSEAPVRLQSFPDQITKETDVVTFRPRRNGGGATEGDDAVTPPRVRRVLGS